MSVFCALCSAGSLILFGQSHTSSSLHRLFFHETSSAVPSYILKPTSHLSYRYVSTHVPSIFLSASLLTAPFAFFDSNRFLSLPDGCFFQQERNFSKQNRWGLLLSHGFHCRLQGNQSLWIHFFSFR